MKEGWNAIVGPEYVRSLEVNLNVDLSGLNGNTQAFEVLSELYAQLYDLHSDGLWTGLLLDNLSFGGPADGPTLRNPNRDSWVRAAFVLGVNVWYASSLCGCSATVWSRDWVTRFLARTILFAETMKIDVSTWDDPGLNPVFVSAMLMLRRWPGFQQFWLSSSGHWCARAQTRDATTQEQRTL